MQQLTLKKFSVILPLLHLCLVTMGLIGVGWLLAAFQVSWVIWLITFSLAIYLATKGTDGIVLSSAWVVSFTSAGAVIKAWPVVWGTEIPDKAAKFWASVFLLFWAGAIALVGLLATAEPPMTIVLSVIGMKKRHSKSMLVALSSIALGSGWVLYAKGYSGI
ncbi:MAG: hypothetical protein AAFR31_17170 [Cyanobacteria bacterium J06627_8]